MTNLLTETETLHTGDNVRLHSWDIVTAVNGPGTRLTLFLSGCPLRCLYCQNPDTIDYKNGTLTNYEEIFSKVKKYRKMYKITGGGITISGGEPLFQHAFVKRLFKDAHELGIHTALDTSGHLGRLVDKEMMKNIDLVLLDVKAGNETTYKKVTSRKLQPTIDFGNRLSENNVKTWVRFVLVPDLTDDYENIEQVAQIVSKWNNVERLEILPFHQLGKQKWVDSGKEYLLSNTKPPSKELIERVKKQFESYGINTFV